MDAASTLAPP